jgi:hypothetical protein
LYYARFIDVLNVRLYRESRFAERGAMRTRKEGVSDVP